MELLVEKLGLFPIKFPSKPEDYHHTKNSTPLHDFRSKISNFIAQIRLNPGNHKGPSKSHCLEFLQNCFELINITNRAFIKLVVETNHPTSQWSGELTASHLSYTLNSLDLVNSVTASLSHLNQAKMSVSQAVRLMKNNSRVSAAKYLKKIHTGNFQAKFLILRLEEETRVSEKKERVILQALMIVKKIGLLAMGLVVSSLCSDAKIYLEIRKLIPGGFEDSLIKVLDSRFCKVVMEIQGEMEEVREVNRVVEDLSRNIISDGKFDEHAVGELNGRLMALENSIQGIEKQANNLFSEVLGTRNSIRHLSLRQRPTVLLSFSSATVRIFPTQLRVLQLRISTRRSTFPKVYAWTSNDTKVGVTIEVDGSPWKVIEFLQVKPGKGAAFVRTTFTNFVTGNQVERTFRAGSKIEEADIFKETKQYTYKAGAEADIFWGVLDVCLLCGSYRKLVWEKKPGWMLDEYFLYHILRGLKYIHSASHSSISFVCCSVSKKRDSYIPKLEPFSRSRLDRALKDPPLQISSFLAFCNRES